MYLFFCNLNAYSCFEFHTEPENVVNKISVIFTFQSWQACKTFFSSSRIHFNEVRVFQCLSPRLPLYLNQVCTRRELRDIVSGTPNNMFEVKLLLVTDSKVHNKTRSAFHLYSSEKAWASMYRQSEILLLHLW